MIRPVHVGRKAARRPHWVLMCWGGGEQGIEGYRRVVQGVLRGGGPPAGVGRSPGHPGRQVPDTDPGASAGRSRRRPWFFARRVACSRELHVRNDAPSTRLQFILSLTRSRVLAMGRVPKEGSLINKQGLTLRTMYWAAEESSSSSSSSSSSKSKSNRRILILVHGHGAHLEFGASHVPDGRRAPSQTPLFYPSTAHPSHPSPPTT